MTYNEEENSSFDSFEDDYEMYYKAKCTGNYKKDVLRFEDRHGKITCSGKMEDGPTWFAVYEDKTVIISGYGTLIFNLRDVPKRLCHSQDGMYQPVYNVIVIGDFTRIGDSEFFDWPSLASIKLPKSISRIEGRSFCDTDCLKTIYIPSDIEYISSGAFGYSGIEEVIFFEKSKVKPDIIQLFRNKNRNIIIKLLERGKTKIYK